MIKKTCVCSDVVYMFTLIYVVFRFLVWGHTSAMYVLCSLNLSNKIHYLLYLRVDPKQLFNFGASACRQLGGDGRRRPKS